MTIEKQVLRLVEFGSEKSASSLVGVETLHKTAMRRPDFRLAGAGRKPQNLVGLLLGHGARARRGSMPRCGIRIEVYTPAGLPAVEISFK